MTIFESLRSDHETQRTLIDLLTKTEGDHDGRRELYERLKRELEAHAGAEERYFYVPLMEHDLTQDKARHSVAEHKELGFDQPIADNSTEQGRAQNRRVELYILPKSA